MNQLQKQIRLRKTEVHCLRRRCQTRMRTSERSFRFIEMSTDRPCARIVLCRRTCNDAIRAGTCSAVVINSSRRFDFGPANLAAREKKQETLSGRDILASRTRLAPRAIGSNTTHQSIIGNQRRIYATWTGARRSGASVRRSFFMFSSTTRHVRQVI